MVANLICTISSLELKFDLVAIAAKTAQFMIGDVSRVSTESSPIPIDFLLESSTHQGWHNRYIDHAFAYNGCGGECYFQHPLAIGSIFLCDLAMILCNFGFSILTTILTEKMGRQ